MTTSFTDRLRALSDEALGELLRARPDLITPVPPDLAALAARAQTRLSLARVVERLDRFTLEILDAARLTRSDDGYTSMDAIVALAAVPSGGPEPARVREAVHALQKLLLLYGPEEELRLTGAIDEVLSAYPAGLGRPAAELDPAADALAADPARLRRTLLAAPPSARAVLDRLAEGPPVGTFSEPPTAVLELLEQHLLVRLDDQTVELPRELGLLLRRDQGPLGRLHPQPPELPAGTRPQATIDRAGAGQAMTVVREAEAVLEALAAEPISILRGGGLGVLPLRRLAKAAELPEPTAALLVEVVAAAGLIGETETEYLPAAGYDGWRDKPLAQRWTQLAQAWLNMPRQPSLIGLRDERDRPITALAPEAERAGMPGLRRELLGSLPLGTAPSEQDVLDLLGWRTPIRVRGREAVYSAVLAEAASLGVTGFGGLTAFGALLIDDGENPEDDPLGRRPGADRPREESPASLALGALLPPPVDHLMVQADLTVVVPGPPEPQLAAELDMVADHESGGGAVVYRVTRDSVRRALDAGYAAADLHTLFGKRSRTPVPQALTYLIDDISRTHGGLRTGAAGSYLRSDDEALIASALADRRLSGLSLRRLAPTVLITLSPPGRLLAALREAGYTPVPEDPTGAVVLSKPKVRRAPARAVVAPPIDPASGLTRPRLLGIVEHLRHGDAAARAAKRAPLAVRAATGGTVDGITAVQAHSDALAVLQQAVRDKARVWVGYVDAHGTTNSRLVRPVSIGAGYLRAEDERTQTIHTFALSRVTAAVPET
ncbi:helicase-associated domain-containing protein [Hamadaea sp. NPDC051192]|uniref:helicase-associated domain-containing protein n=1 Tax=Hamadaea sp. NPDC051192 TaxID=3154940 RepID=UPI0034229747